MDMVKKSFLRACINHGILNNEQIDKILSPLCEHYKVPKPEGMEAVKEFVSDVETSIKEFNQALTFTLYPITNREYLVYTITDTSSDIPSHPNLLPEECQYFSLLLDKMAKEDNCCILWNEVYSNLDFKAGKPIKKVQMQTLLKQWCDMGYFVEKSENVYLGPRTIVEFEFYLRSNYADNLTACSLCKQLVFWSFKCADCQTKIHRDCIRKYLRTRNNCPSCNEKWTTPLQ